MSSSNLGRVQGGGFFGSSATSTTSITKTTVQTNGSISPLVGDTIVNANGDLCKITAITSSAYTVTKYGSIKGATGAKGADGANGKDGQDAKQPEALVTFNGQTITYEKWVENCENGVYGSSLVGQTATVKNFVFGQDWTLRLIGVNHDKSHTDGSALKTTWEFTEIVCRTPLGLPFDYFDYDADNEMYYPSNAHGYGTATTLQTLLLSILSSMPAVVREHIKLAKKTCYIPRKYIDGSVGAETQDEGYRLFCLSGVEIGAGTTTSWIPSDEGTCYAYYDGINSTSANTKRVKKEKSGSTWYYWLRSPDASDTNYFCCVNDNGRVDYNRTYDDSNGAAPAFCL